MLIVNRDECAIVITFQVSARKTDLIINILILYENERFVSHRVYFTKMVQVLTNNKARNVI